MTSFRDHGRSASHGPNVPLAEGGLPEGAEVLTLDGAIPVEYLCVGDRVLTRESGAMPVSAIIREVREVGAVQIRPRAMAVRMPMRPVLMPACQQVLLRGHRAQSLFGQPFVVTQIGMMVDDDRIRDLGRRRLVLYRLILERAQVIYAGGLELISHKRQMGARSAA